jgi:hypothetical protein
MRPLVGWAKIVIGPGPMGPALPAPFGRVAGSSNLRRMRLENPTTIGYFMVTVHRAHGFRFVIFVNDHSPPHVHVFGQGGEAKVVLEGPDGIKLDWVAGISRSDLRRVLQEVERERSRLIATWRRIHER